MSAELLAAVGAKIRKLREASGASQEGFARAAGIDRAYLGKIERGTQNVSILTAARIAVALRVSLSTLFEGTPCPEQPDSAAD